MVTDKLGTNGAIFKLVALFSISNCLITASLSIHVGIGSTTLMYGLPNNHLSPRSTRPACEAAINSASMVLSKTQYACCTSSSARILTLKFYPAFVRKRPHRSKNRSWWGPLIDCWHIISTTSSPFYVASLFSIPSSSVSRLPGCACTTNQISGRVHYAIPY